MSHSNIISLSDLSILQSQGESIVHEILELLEIILVVLTTTLALDFPQLVFVGEGTDNGDMTCVEHEVAAVLDSNAIVR